MFLHFAEQGVFTAVEQTIMNAIEWVRLGVEAISAIIICIGVIAAIYQFVLHFRNGQPRNFNQVRLILGKYLSLALEFQLGADILSTAIAPSWSQIGQLAVIAIIRTLLNYFLTKELERERKQEKESSEQHEI